MANYTREHIALDNILLDVENPRFASYFERMGRTQPTQSDVTDYLISHESIGGLATRIQAVGDLHPAESIVCCKQGDKYIVLEGNRRVCACKALHRIFSENSKAWLPEEVLPEFPLLQQTKQEDSELIKNTSVLNTVVYESRDLAQPYISDKHIDGVKKWESIEKSSYFYRMYQNEKKNNLSMSVNQIINKVAKQSVSNRTEVKNCIVKYGFFMCVYNVLREVYRPEALTGTNSYLPLVDRFMGVLVGNSDVGLNLALTDLKYTAHSGKEELYKNILKLVGEAFLVRKTESNCNVGELPRINSKEIDTNAQQRKLIKDDIRIPGLYTLIKQYKEISEIHDESKANRTKSKNGEDNTQGRPESSPLPDDDTQTSSNNGEGSTAVYEPVIPWKPSRPQNKSLSFLPNEGSTFKLSDNDDEDAKIKFIIRELSKLYVFVYPYACTLLYRTLLEAATRKAFKEKKPRENNQILTYKENDLAGMILKLTNNSGALILQPAERGAIKSNISQQNLIRTLNDYIHNPKLVDTNLIFSSWITMKKYIIACLTSNCLTD